MIKNENKDDCLLKNDQFSTYTSEFYYVPKRTFCEVRNPSLVNHK